LVLTDAAHSFVAWLTISERDNLLVRVEVKTSEIPVRDDLCAVKDRHPQTAALPGGPHRTAALGRAGWPAALTDSPSKRGRSTDRHFDVDIRVWAEGPFVHSEGVWAFVCVQ